MWIGAVAALVGLVVMYITKGWNVMFVTSGWVVWVSTDSFTLVAVPLFILMGIMIAESGLGERVYAAAAPVLNHFPGGLLYANILAGALFAACSGSTVASSATIGSIALPEMEKRGYPFSISAGSVGAGGLLAAVIPPSLMLIFYASITEQSIGRLFAAGVIPGLILVVLFLSYITLRFRFYKRWKEIRGEVLPWKTALAKTISIWPIIALIVMVLGSIFAGIATPTEAAAVGAFGAILLAILYRRFSWQVLKRATFSTLRITSQLMFIYVGVKIMSAALARAGLITFTTKALVSLPVPPLVILVLIYVLFLILGMFLESLPLLLMVVPVVFPAIVALGYDPIWFGIAATLVCLTGNFTPPVGVTLFVLQTLRPDKPITEIYKGLAPFAAAVLVGLVIITAFPQLVLFLPRLWLG
jgi:tripartite ATP-independent transporter DctM subunit